jgi:predicted Zn-dependent peptidase
VLKDKWDPALALAADAVTKPRFDAKEWKRFHTLWTNELKNRSSEPRAVLQVLARSVLFGKDSPAGHPVDGFRDSADKVTLEDVRKAYQSHFRPEKTRVVFVGDITKDEALQALNRHFGSWRPAPAPKTEPAKVVGGPVESFPLVMVDRPDAPQAVIAWAKVGIPMTHAELAPLERANTALGGSFTSRLNMDLREERGWSYGAHSRVSADRVTGILMASAAVFADKTAPALEDLACDIEVFATKGLTDVEAQRTQFQARAERVAAYESNDTVADILILDALRDLGPTFQATFAESTDKATKGDLDRMAKNYFQKAGATLMVVGPKAQVVPQLVAMGMPEPVFFDEEGRRKGPKSGEP